MFGSASMIVDVFFLCFQDDQTNRTLTLISKTIQGLGNMVSSRTMQTTCKEEYMGKLYEAFYTEKRIQDVRQVNIHSCTIKIKNPIASLCEHNVYGSSSVIGAHA